MRAFHRILVGAGMCVAALALGASCERTVVLTPRVQTVDVGAVPAALPVGERVTLTAVARDASGDPLPDKPVYWKSEDTTVVRVDSTGSVRARRPGTARIIAGSEDKRREVEIVVPEGPVLAFNTYMPRELSEADDADEWTFEGRTGQLLNVFLQGLSNVPAHQFRLRVIGPGGPLDSMTVAGTDTTRRARALRWLRLPQNGPYRVRVDGTRGDGEKAAYQLMVETVNPRPETVTDSIPLNTYITTETLGPGDIDTYTFRAAGGQDLSAIFKAESGKAADALRLLLYAPNGSEVRFIHGNGDYETFQASGRLPLTQTGIYTVRVEGLSLTAQGRYQFAVFAINRRPEVANRTAPPNVQLSGEGLLPQGDVDEYTFRVAEQQEVNVYMQARSPARADTMMLRVLRPNGSVMDSVRSLGGDPDLFGRAINYLSLPPAEYTIQVDGGRNVYGPYTFMVRTINLTPEAVPVAYTLGTTVTTDISPVGDVDQFTFRGNRNEVLQITFKPTSGSANDVLRLYLRRANGMQVAFRDVAGNQLPLVFEATLPETDNYIIRVQGVNSSNDSGFYYFRVVKLR